MSARSFFEKACRHLKHLAVCAIRRVLYYPRAMSIMSMRQVCDRTLYVDVSCLYFGNQEGGISRVVKKFCESLKQQGVKHKFIYTEAYKGFFSCEDKKRIRFLPNDVFFCPGFTLECADNGAFFNNMMKNGVKVYFFLHDLIPVHFPSFYDDVDRFRMYFDNMFLRTGIITNSKTVMSDAKAYMQKLPKHSVNPDIVFDYAYLGCDLPKSDLKMDKVNGSFEFLMVSTVEPRKKYDQALQAFDILWKKGVDAKLTIVGRPGWKNESVIHSLETHPQLNKRLFWHKKGISDQELAALYQKCDAVIFASLEEGYGLAVVEAERYNRPVILRDIPVFREIAGDGAYYFCGLEGKNLSDAVEKFIECKKAGSVKLPSVKSNTWEEFTVKALDFVWNKE